MSGERLTELVAGMPIPFGGDRLTHVPEALAAAFRPGDRLIVVQQSGELLHVPGEAHEVASAAVTRAAEAFAVMGGVQDEAISDFFNVFANRLEDDDSWAPIAAANALDVASAKARGRSTTRLVASARMRADMIAGLREWRDAPPSRGRTVERIQHDGWSVEQLTAPLGVVGFVFEGRPNVFADAAGVLRGGNTVVFRIGSDALGTAMAIVKHALAPALEMADVPNGACVLVESADRAAGWALFSDARLGLAVARGSGQAVAQLGSVARQAGVPVSLHGTGGAWMVADETAVADRFAAAVAASIDRKVCNTLNVCCIVRSRASELVPLLMQSLGGE
jgi:glutamate-5-semialdehyde dehydrogenase